MMVFLTLILCIGAALCFAIAKPKNHRQITGTPAPLRRMRVLRGLGWILTVLGAVAATAATVEWLIAVALVAGGLALGGVIVTFILTYRPRLLRFAA